MVIRILMIGDSQTFANPQMRVLNPHLTPSLRNTDCTLPAQIAVARNSMQPGGVSSFGYSGTITHVVLTSQSAETEMTESNVFALQKRSFPWREQRRNAKSGRHHRALSRLSTRGAVAGPPRVYADHHPKFVHGRDENSFRSRSRTRDLIAHRKNHTLYIFGCFSEAKKHR